MNEITATINKGHLKGKNVEIKIGKTPQDSEVYIEGKKIHTVTRIDIIVASNISSRQPIVVIQTPLLPE